jgi:hypothetical protein
MAKLLNRFGRRLGALHGLHVEYPVGRAGSRFGALVPASAFESVGVTALRHFVVQDDGGNRYPAVIEFADSSTQGTPGLVLIRGFVVASGR